MRRSRLLALLLTLLLPTGVPGAQGQAQPLAPAPAHAGIRESARRLSPEQRLVEARSLAAVRQDPQAWIDRYVKRVTSSWDQQGRLLIRGTSDISVAMERGPLLVSTDEAKELFPAYSADSRSRSLHSESVHAASKLLASMVWQRALQQPLRLPRNIVLFTAGGAASGKTTALRRNSAVQHLMPQVQIIRDTTLADETTSKVRVAEVLASGRTAQIVLVVTPIRQAVKWLVDRAMREGRSVPASAMARSHWRSQQTVLSLDERFRDNPAVRINLIFNDGSGTGRLLPIEDLARMRFDRDPRFPSESAFIRYVNQLVREEIQSRKLDLDPADPSAELEYSILMQD